MRVLLVTLLLIFAGATPAVASDVWEQMRETPGLVLYLRHATAPGGGDPAGFVLGDCSTQRNLSAAGRAEARRIGERLKRERIPITAVRASPWCRARDTARLLDAGQVRSMTALGSLFLKPNAARHPHTKETVEVIRAHRNRPGVLVLVGHQANISALTGVSPRSGEGVVLRAQRNGDIRVVARFP
jgi:phosphohistidine phosphatase SixA